MNSIVLDVFKEFLDNIGIESAQINELEMVRLELDVSGILTLECTEGSDVVVSVAKQYSKSDVNLFEAVLNLCKLESRGKQPIRAGLVQSDYVAFSSRIPSDAIDVASIFRVFKNLTSQHQRLEAGVR